MGWLLEKLQEKVAELEGVEEPSQESEAEVETVEELGPVTKEFYGIEQTEPVVASTPVVQEIAPVYKTDKEVIAEMQQGIKRPEITDYSLAAKWEVCDYLYKVLLDGSYRAVVLKIKPREDSLRDFVSDLWELKNTVKEGELKAEVDYFINLFNNL
jgi:hypothetical protein